MEMTVREFQAGDEGAFQRLNEEWIERYFAIEAKDRVVLGDPQGEIVDKGGRVLLAVDADGVAVGCCALAALGADEYELAKMAVTPRVQGLGVGRQLMAAAIAAARQMGARRLYLETNAMLTPAIRLYEAAGFRRVEARGGAPSVYRRADVFMELLV